MSMHEISVMEQKSRMKELVRQKVESDPFAADFQFSLLVAAANSYRHHTVLSPYPPMFLKPDQVSEAEGKDAAALKLAIRSVPSIQQLKEGSLQSLEEGSLELLHWCLDAKNFHLRTCSKELFSEIIEKTQQVYVAVPNPNYIFEVVYTDNAENKFLDRAGDSPLAYAYHGSRVDNFHSIIHYGLQSHMSKNALFGEGTYLSSELSVSMPYAPTGHLWEHSQLGDTASCVAVCQLISDDPSVKCQVKDQSTGERSSVSSSSRARVAGSLGGDVPEKYYVVRNNDVMRVKYVLVYADRHKHKRVNSWFAQHKFFVLITLYALLLVCIGLYNSQTFGSFIRRLTRR